MGWSAGISGGFLVVVVLSHCLEIYTGRIVLVTAVQGVFVGLV